MFTVYGMSDSGNCYKVKLTLPVMEQHLEREPFFVAGRYTIADGGFAPRADARVM